MGSTMPFPNETSTGLNPGARRRRDPSGGFEFVSQGHQPPLRYSGQTAMGELLQPIGDGPHHDVAAQSRRLGPV